MTRSRLRLLAVPLASALLALAGCGGSSSTGGATTADGGAATQAGASVPLGPAFGSMTGLPGVQTGAPPWTSGGRELEARLKAIGLPALSAEGQALHIHQHLDVYVDGTPVSVPADIGIDPGGGFISPLHTHDPTGVIHVESPTVQSFTLGQFFGVWGVRLSRSCLGGLCSKPLALYVNGRRVDADPTRLILAEHQEIVLAYGTPPAKVPASYDFPAGL